MTEISEAAKRKARELIDAGSLNHAAGDPVWIVVLARVLQEHSDVAKEAMRWARTPMVTNVPLADCLKSLILPDEPCEHELSFKVGGKEHGAMLCKKCGKELKIVEAGDE